MESSTLAGCAAAGRAPEPATLLAAEVERHFQSFPHRGIAASRLTGSCGSLFIAKAASVQPWKSRILARLTGAGWLRFNEGSFCAGMIRAASFHPGLLAIRGWRSLLEKGRRSVPEELPAGCHPALIHFSLEFRERVSSIGLRVERVAGAGGGEGKFAINQISDGFGRDRSAVR